MVRQPLLVPDLTVFDGGVARRRHHPLLGALFEVVLYLFKARQSPVYR